MIRIGAILMLLALALPADARLAGLARDATAPRGVAVLEMRPTARVPADTTLLVRHVARVDGMETPLASRLLDLPLGRERLATADGWVTIDHDEVRRVLEQSGADESVYLLRGRRAEVRAIAPVAPRAEPTVPRAGPETPASALGDTLRARIEHRVRTTYGVERQDLRLGFRDRDAGVLDTPIAGRTVHIEPVGRSRELPLSVTIYAGDRIDLHTTIRVTVMIHREVLRLTAPVRRGERVRPAIWAKEKAWVPAAEGYADAPSATDAVATAALRAGEIILSRHVEPPIVVRRGDLVTVHCVSGTVIVKTEARATRDARAGEIIEFTGGSGRRATADTPRFQARVLGPGVAVSRVEDQHGVAAPTASIRTGRQTHSQTSTTPGTPAATPGAAQGGRQSEVQR